MRYLSLCLVLLVWGCRENSLAPSNISQSNVASTNNTKRTGQEISPLRMTINGLYYGTSDSRLGRLAWLMKVQDGQAVLYMPPNNLAVRSIMSRPDGYISFETDQAVGGSPYKFSGQAFEDRIEGKFDFLHAAELIRVSTTLRRIDSGALSKHEPGGLYSNVTFVEEGGDLIGAELILIPDMNGVVGVYSSYENEMTPYATLIRRSGNRIKFEIQTGSSFQSFEGTLSPNEIRLNYVGKDANPDIEEMVLSKKQDLEGVIRH